MIETTDKQHTERYRNRWFGKYRAFVRDNNDPERLGRVRMEIPAVLGTGLENWSEWAYPCFPFGGHDDRGFFYVPDEGASVWAEFEGGIAQHPIWTGVWLAMTTPGEQPHESKRQCNEPDLCLDCEDKVWHKSNPIDDKEHKKYHQHPPFSCPRFRVLMKSETGHTILCDDKDEHECMKIIDRAGQMLHFESPVKRIGQVGNVLRRSIRDAEHGTQFDPATALRDQRARIQITDLSGQCVRWEAWHDNEKIHILSRDRIGSRWQKILIDTSRGREKIRLIGLNGLQEIVIDSTAGRENITMRDRAGQRVVMNAAAGAESIHAVDRSGSNVLLDASAGNIIIRASKKTLINP